MVRFTEEIAGSARVFVNALREREIDFDGLEITLLDGSNAMHMLTSFDTLTFSNNDIPRLEGFPTDPKERLIRVKTLNFTGNTGLNSIQPDIAKAMPFIEMLSLEACGISTIAQLKPLADLQCLRSLILRGNPIEALDDYRQKVKALLPQLVYLDFNTLTVELATSGTKRPAQASAESKRPKRAIPTKESLLKRLSEATTTVELDAVERQLKQHYPEEAQE